MSTIDRRSPTRLRALLARLVRTIALWRARARERRLVATLSHDQLKDMGLTRADALREATKPFWRA